jgi:hypothetical protein
LQLRLANTTGLSLADVKQLAGQLEEAAADFAKQNTVCVFNLVDLCQDFLRDHNEAAQQAAAAAALEEQQQLEAAAAAAAAGEGAADAQSLWHEMQQRMQQQAAEREAEVSVGAGGAGALSSNVLGEDLWMFDGGLFAEEGGSGQCVLPQRLMGGMVLNGTASLDPTTGAATAMTCNCVGGWLVLVSVMMRLVLKQQSLQNSLQDSCTAQFSRPIYALKDRRFTLQSHCHAACAGIANAQQRENSAGRACA